MSQTTDDTTPATAEPNMEREYAETAALTAASIFLSWAEVTGEVDRWIVNNHYGPERAEYFRAALKNMARKCVDEALTRAERGLMDLSRSEQDWAELRAKLDADLRARVSRLPGGRGRPRKAAKGTN